MNSHSAPVACTCQASWMLTLLVGLVGFLLSGCVTTMPDAGSQLAALRSDLQHVAAEVARLHEVDHRFRTELSDEIQATHELLTKVVARLHEVEAQVQERHQATPPAVQVVPVPEASRAMEQALEQLRRRTQALEQRLATPAARGHEPRTKGSAQTSSPSSTAPAGPRGLMPGMSQTQVLTQLGPPTGVQETPDVVYWFYDAAKSMSVSFDRTTGKVQAWLGW
jgi:TolA-binding protein